MIFYYFICILHISEYSFYTSLQNDKKQRESPIHNPNPRPKPERFFYTHARVQLDFDYTCRLDLVIALTTMPRVLLTSLGSNQSLARRTLRIPHRRQ